MFDRMLLIDKPCDMTSFGVVARVRRVLSKQAGKKLKVGHTGTLDPFATGLLILMTGKMTKKCQEFLKLDKRYEATIRLGARSTTGDPEGEITEVVSEDEGRLMILGEAGASLAVPSREEVERAVSGFIGEIEQRVPRYSAVKIEGRRAYDLVRKGVEVEMPTRKVKIYDIRILEYSYPILKIDCKVSSGTYIRTLGEDIGEALLTGAYLTELRRTEIGEYKVSEATKLADFMKENGGE